MAMASSGVAHNGRLTRWLSACGVVAPSVFAAFVMAATVVTPGYSHLSQSVSQLGGQGRPHPEVMNTGFFVYALLIGVFASGLSRQLGHDGWARLAWGSMVVYAFAVVLCGIFQAGSKATGTYGNVEDNLHVTFAVVTFITFTVSMLSLSMTARRDPAWRHLWLVSLVLAAVNMPLAVAFQLRWAPSLEGLVQRCVFGTCVVWLQAVSLNSYRLASRVSTAPASQAMSA